MTDQSVLKRKSEYRKLLNVLTFGLAVFALIGLFAKDMGVILVLCWLWIVVIGRRAAVIGAKDTNQGFTVNMLLGFIPALSVGMFTIEVINLPEKIPAILALFPIISIVIFVLVKSTSEYIHHFDPSLQA